MTAGKRSTKPAPPAALTVPRMRAIRDEGPAQPSPGTPTEPMTRPRRNRKPKFVF